MKNCRDLLAGIILAFSDMLALTLSFLLAYYMAVEIVIPTLRPLGISPLRSIAFHRLTLFLLWILWIIIAFSHGMYSRRMSFWEEIRACFKTSFFATLLVFSVTFLVKKEEVLSRTLLLLTFGISLVAVPLIRLSAKKLLYRKGLWKKKCLIVGRLQQIAPLVVNLMKEWPLGYEIVGIVDETSQQESFRGIEVFRNRKEIPEIIKEKEVRTIFIDLQSNTSPKELTEVEELAESIRLLPPLNFLSLGWVEIESIGDLSVLRLHQNLFKPWNVVIKNVGEFLFALVATILSLPLFLVIAIAIKLDSEGKILFVQERLGKGGRVFKMFKFRTMYPDADERLRRYLQEHPEKKEEWEKYRKLRGEDPRVTRVGKFLRKWSLDELPQLLNVLKGEMSIVGPRPYMKEELPLIGEYSRIIFRVKPGITGLWQVRGRSELPFRERLLLDEFYVRNWSLWLDIVILFKTIKIVLSGRGAF